MVSELLIQNEPELQEFYEWLLSRAREKEIEGNKSHSLLYKTFADKVKIHLDGPDSDPIRPPRTVTSISE